MKIFLRIWKRLSTRENAIEFCRRETFKTIIVRLAARKQDNGGQCFEGDCEVQTVLTRWLLSVGHGVILGEKCASVVAATVWSSGGIEVACCSI